MNHIKNKILTRNGYLLLKSELTTEHIAFIEKKLTVKPLSHPDYTVDVKPYKIFSKDDKYYYIPRYFAIKYFGDPLCMNELYFKHNEENISGTIEPFTFNGQLREKQVNIANICIDSITKKGGGVITLPCGAGKTVISIYISHILRKLESMKNMKVLVIVHKTFLQNQWINRIKQFTNARIGTIRQKKIDIKNKDIIVGMLQSIAMIEYDPKIFDNIGLVIVDECHHIGSKVFSQALFKIGARYTIGLSATPYRNDGLSKVIFWHLGKIIYKEFRKTDNKVIVKNFNYESTDKLFVEKTQWINRKVKPSSPKMITNICKIQSRNTFCIDIINNLRMQPDRKILVLSGRLDHLTILKDGIDKILASEINDGNLVEGECTTAYYKGGMKEKQLENSAEADIIFGTFEMAEEGLDIDGLNTLFLATPKKNIIQSIGRILRKPIQYGDIYPMVVDINDMFSIYVNWNNVRQKYYTDQNYLIDNYMAIDDKCLSVKSYLLKKKIITREEFDDKNLDVRKKYFIHMYGEDMYEIEEEIGFENDPIAKYKNDTDLNKIFEFEYEYQDVENCIFSCDDFDDKNIDNNIDKDNTEMSPDICCGNSSQPPKILPSSDKNINKISNSRMTKKIIDRAECIPEDSRRSNKKMVKSKMSGNNSKRKNIIDEITDSDDEDNIFAIAKKLNKK